MFCIKPYCQCVADSSKLPGETLSFVKDHVEMDDWIQPINKQRPFYISSLKYTKIAVDRVMGTNSELYNVLFLATGVFILLWVQFMQHA